MLILQGLHVVKSALRAGGSGTSIFGMEISRPIGLLSSKQPLRWGEAVLANADFLQGSGRLHNKIIRKAEAHDRLRGNLDIAVSGQAGKYGSRSGPG